MSDIYSALAAVMADVSHVAKRDINQHQRFNFRGVDAVVNAVGPVLRKHGVIVVPTVDEVDYATVQTSGGKASTACRIRATYTFYAADGSCVATSVAAESWDTGDKAAPKAMSVAFRTALLQALCLPTDDPDPDLHTFERADRVTGEVPAPVSEKTRAHLFALFAQKGIPDEKQLAGINAICGAAYSSRADLSEADAARVIGSLRQRPDKEAEA